MSKVSSIQHHLKNEEDLINFFHSSSSSTKETLLLEPLTKLNDTVLHLAAQRGYVNFFRSLPPHGTPWNTPNAEGKVPLHDAAQFSQPTVLSFLLQDAGLSPDPIKRADWTPLMLACTKPHNLSCIRLLIEEGGADTSRVNKDGWTPFHLLARTGDSESIKYLLSIRPESWRTRSTNGRTPLHTAALHGHSQLVERLVHLYEFEEEDSTGSTPIMEAVRGGHLDVVKLLCYNDLIDTKTVDKMGRNYFCIAAHVGKLDILKYFALLIDPGAEFSKKSSSSGMSPLHWAASGGQRDVLDYLTRVVKRDVFEDPDDNGRTPLDHGILSGCGEAVSVILRALGDKAPDLREIEKRMGRIMKPHIRDVLISYCSSPRN
eukprot:TRINITY_DN791_c0_g1_i1.p1 TRINITY_DN791_c0_g1~~TRINITY_DN791_c0_g1_i1.p1  ORF type:complete len:374 (+),score=73.35 TRINITY_DN791_c0_g1_i1:239-1360(+)